MDKIILKERLSYKMMTLDHRDLRELFDRTKIMWKVAGKIIKNDKLPFEITKIMRASIGMELVRSTKLISLLNQNSYIWFHESAIYATRLMSCLTEREFNYIAETVNNPNYDGRLISLHLFRNFIKAASMLRVSQIEMPIDLDDYIENQSSFNFDYTTI